MSGPSDKPRVTHRRTRPGPAGAMLNRDPNGPSDKAVEAAAARWARIGIPYAVALPESAAALAAAHDPALGLDRSVCLRGVVEALRDSSIAEGVDSPFGAADFLEREFGGGA